MTGRAGVTLKIATSLDARIALANGVSQWITNSKSRARAHQMRAEHDAVLVGIGTVLADDPLLTARTVPLPDSQPVRIIADSKLRTPQHSRLVESLSTAPLVIAHADEAETAAWSGLGVELWAAGDGQGRVSPIELLRRARALGLNRIFLEGGGHLAASFLKLGLIDRIAWFRAPILIGGDGRSAIGHLGFERMDETSRWVLESRETIDEDSLEIWQRQGTL